MDHQGVAIADVAEQGVELGTLGVLAGSLVGEHLFYLGTFQLSIRILVQGTDPDIADPLSLHAASWADVYG
ncbi:hypothetical protein D3C84_1295040 [compost metagenome]